MPLGGEKMPVYDFRCEDCGNKFTLLCKISERDQVTCPHCQSKNIKQLITACGFQIKGGNKRSCPPAGGG